MLESVRSLLECTSRCRWSHQSDVGIEDLPLTTMPKTFGEALSGAGWGGQTDSVGAGISMNKPTQIYVGCT